MPHSRAYSGWSRAASLLTSTTNAGRSRFMLPSPYAAHAPIAGRPLSWWPVQKNVIAGSWLIASVCSERTTHSSSAILAVCGSSSLNGRPLRPWRAKRANEPAIGSAAWLPLMPVSRWPPRTESGSGWPWRARRIGFSSNSSNGDGPPAWNR